LPIRYSWLPLCVVCHLPSLAFLVSLASLAFLVSPAETGATRRSSVASTSPGLSPNKRTVKSGRALGKVAPLLACDDFT
jgi:hypothetical protein